MKYIHRFSRSLSCEVEVTDEHPVQGNNYVLNIAWDGERKLKHHAEYVRWMHLIHSDCANRWNKKIMQAVQLPKESLAELKADMIKWMVVIQIPTWTGIIGILLVLLSKH